MERVVGLVVKDRWDHTEGTDDGEHCQTEIPKRQRA